MGIGTGEISILDALIISAVGIAIVFAVLVILMGIIMLMGLIADKSPAIAAKLPKLPKFSFGKKKEKATESVGADADAEPAPGTCGELLLVRTEERDAAMIMAIVADTLGTPLNELRFKSIKRVDGQESPTVEKAEE